MSGTSSVTSGGSNIPTTLGVGSASGVTGPGGAGSAKGLTPSSREPSSLLSAPSGNLSNIASELAKLMVTINKQRQQSKSEAADASAKAEEAADMKRLEEKKDAATAKLIGGLVEGFMQMGSGAASVVSAGLQFGASDSARASGNATEAAGEAKLAATNSESISTHAAEQSSALNREAAATVGTDRGADTAAAAAVGRDNAAEAKLNSDLARDRANDAVANRDAMARTADLQKNRADTIGKSGELAVGAGKLGSAVFGFVAAQHENAADKAEMEAKAAKRAHDKMKDEAQEAGQSAQRMMDLSREFQRTQLESEKAAILRM
jgi:hypothetical protein